MRQISRYGIISFLSTLFVIIILAFCERLLANDGIVEIVLKSDVRKQILIDQRMVWKFENSDVEFYEMLITLKNGEVKRILINRIDSILIFTDGISDVKVEGSEKVETNSVSVNYSQGQIRIISGCNLTGIEDLQIFSITGTILYKQDVSLIRGTGIINIDLIPGVYFCCFDKKLFFKFIVL